jgi:hypothetical protein
MSKADYNSTSDSIFSEVQRGGRENEKWGGRERSER